ncbi:MAG: hypothetical protein Q4B09_08395, partial [Lachnospiraceae bacterium]|nr:hypothetical protein [Lachnospiraceae bacterium]
MKANRMYKDRLFKFVIENIPGLALELYNALNGTTYTEEDGFEFNTLEDVIYLGMKNDVSFLVGCHLVLYEQQSTVNPNMPLRSFFYTAELLKQSLEATGTWNRIYGSQLLKIPAPKCYVFYCGSSYREDTIELKLSDAFCVPSFGYEWTATVINIGKGHSKKLLAMCRELSDYADFINMVTDGIAQSLSLQDSVDSAVEFFSKQEGAFGMLVKKNRRRVTNFILTEYDEEGVRKVFREEGLAEGRKQG